jgi:hypothetical protein
VKARVKGKVAAKVRVKGLGKVKVMVTGIAPTTMMTTKRSRQGVALVGRSRCSRWRW